ncbi:MAG: carboxypeptidase-like regulatory domain-containing protein [Muribaculaceae bacterium]|nr:carboxypeptidase-like regulatory domain-containing protein [Muribaculaceae bacterium]
MIILILVSYLFLQAANPSYIFSGKVKDPSGEPVPYATIRISDNEYVAVTDLEGIFEVTLQSGNYSGIVTAVGYKSKDFTVVLSHNTSLELVLEEDAVALRGVNVYGKKASQRLEEGAFSVNAVEITPNLNKMVTLNDIVDRTAGVKVRRDGGAGSDFDLTINGLSGNSIRYFIDGVPLESKGTGFTMDNVPLNIIDRVELYKGVVPSHLSSDALGGAVNIITKKKRQNFLDVSYGIGSFCTHNGDITGQYFIPGTAIIIRPTLGLNYSKNNYMMKGVEVWSDREDKYILTNKKRFHDDYFSLFGQIEVGVNDVKWADQFFVGFAYNKVDKDIQTGAMQNKVYG